MPTYEDFFIEHVNDGHVQDTIAYYSSINNLEKKRYQR